jgi:flavin reductase (DIM6/NTAB) family NADH-FMN oxidoreductase RutF
MKTSQIDSVLSLLDREVWIVTAAAGGRRGGLAATWVAPASIDHERPMLLAGIAPNHFTAELIEASGALVAHLLRADQAALAWSFACDSGRGRDKLAGLTTSSTSAGSPILDQCLAWCDCRVFGRYDAGDRLYFWADIVAARQLGSGPVLREQALFQALTDQQREKLAAARQTDIGIQRSLHDQWRRQIANLFPACASPSESPRH